MYRIHPRRPAFTLVELLVVMAVIAVLASLILAGVMYVRRMAPEVQNRNDILQLTGGLQAFYKEYKFYPPDHIKLYSNLSKYGTSPIDQLSLSYLSTMWPYLKNDANGLAWAGRAADGVTALPFPDGVVLHGDQCLVFFLGGMPTGPGQPPQGFFKNPSNPTIAVGTSTDRVIWLNFDGGRCWPLYGAGNPFPSYLDAHAANHDNQTVKKQPFLYFSSGKRPDGYGKTGNTAFGVLPYVQSIGPPTKFYNSTSFQLISAGADGRFGPGGPWIPGNGPSGGNPVGNDDMANFYDRGLGY